ncbi:hypothetical protein ACFL08_03870 [Patescibacteria group bacterium]
MLSVERTQEITEKISKYKRRSWIYGILCLIDTLFVFKFAHILTTIILAFGGMAVTILIFGLFTHSMANMIVSKMELNIANMKSSREEDVSQED